MIGEVRVTVPPRVVALAPLRSYTRAEIEFAVMLAEYVGPFYLAPPRR